MEAILRAPRLLWSNATGGLRLLGAPEALVVASHYAVWVLDPETGAVRHKFIETGSHYQDLHLVGRVLLAKVIWPDDPWGGLEAFDLASGERLWKTSPHPRYQSVETAPGTLVIAGEHAVRGWSALLEEEPRAKPDWTFYPKDSHDSRYRLFIAGGVVLCDELFPIDVVALDRASGEVRWRRAGELVTADANGAVLNLNKKEIAVLNPAGEELWRTEAALNQIALGPTVVAASNAWSGRPLVRLFDRQTGDGVGEIRQSLVTIKIAGQVIYALIHGGAIGAWSLAGDELWRHELDGKVIDPARFAVRPGRLYFSDEVRTLALG